MYVELVDLPARVYRLYGFAWEAVQVTGADNAHPWELLPLPVGILSFMGLVYLPTLYLIKLVHDKVSGLVDARTVYVWTATALILPYAVYLVPVLVPASFTIAVPIPIIPIVALFVSRAGKKIESPWQGAE